MSTTFGDLEQVTKAIESLRTELLFERDDLADRMKVRPFAEQHFLLALNALEAAQRCMTLAMYCDRRGE